MEAYNEIIRKGDYTAIYIVQAGFSVIEIVLLVFVIAFFVWYAATGLNRLLRKNR